MKKYLMAGFLAFLLLCSTGCSKKLTCTKTHDDKDDVVGTEKYVFSFDKDNNSTSARISLVIDYEDDDDYDKDGLKDMAKELEESYKKNDDYSDVSVKVSGKKVSIKYTMKIDKDDAKTYDEVKEMFEEEEYKCK